MKRFNLTGVCVPDKHYMVDLSEKVELIIRDQIRFYTNGYPFLVSWLCKWIDERGGRLQFLCFMKPIINGKGNYYVEPETRDNARMDVVISYGGHEYIVELKIWRGQQYRQKGLDQLEKYLDSRNSDKGYLVSFNLNQHKVYEQNTVILGESRKEVYEIVV